jgi:lambda family phage portal protein
VVYSPGIDCGYRFHLVAYLNWLDSMIATISPEKAVRRAQARNILAAYEAAKPTVLRKQSRDSGSGNSWVSQAGPNLRNQARFLDGNHDLSKGVLNALVNNTVGASGIGIEPQPRTFGGEIHDDLADSLLRLWKNWSKKPECTFTSDWPSVQRLLCRSWMRDGEVFTKNLTGVVPFLDHGTEVKFTLEMLEADMCPLIYDDSAKRIVQGIQRNGWGKPINYYLYRQHPGDINVFNSIALNLTPVSADRINHLAIRERIMQLRGISVFTSVMTRLDDIKDYEESERIAAKIAASMAAFIKKGQPDMYEPNTDGTSRSLRFSPGMVFDDLMPGEEIGTIDTNRPNPQLVEFRKGQLRAIAAGTGVNYSTIARDYDGSYSSQRQELVEGWANYQVLTSEFVGKMVQPAWETFVKMAVLDGLVKVPADIDPLSLDDALFIGPSMPWIDPLKEIKGNSEGERAGYIAGPEIIRKRGGNPRDVIEQEARWRRQLQAKGLISTSDPANDNPTQPGANNA